MRDEGGTVACSASQSKHAGESDGEKDEAELSEISKLLEKHDPAFMKYVVCALYAHVTLTTSDLGYQLE